LSGWTIAQADQDATHDYGTDAKPDSYPLQWAESAPLTGAEKVHGYDANDDERAEHDNGDAELSLGDHSPHIITRGWLGATRQRRVRIEK
jgi:hypothetical protein